MKRYQLLWLFAISLIPGVLVAQQPREFVVGFPQDNMANEWRAAQVFELQQALQPYRNIRVIYSDAQGSTARQILDMQRMVDQGADVIVISPRDATAMTQAIAAVYRSGIPVVLLTRRIHTQDYSCFIGADDRRIATDAAHALARRMGGRGRVVMLQGVATATTAIQRREGFLQALKEYPQIQLVAAPVANYNLVEAIRAMEKIIAEGLEFDAIYAHSDSMAVGARMAMRAAKIDPKGKLIVGIDYISEAREAIRAGEQSISFTYPTAGRQGAEAVLRILHGKKLEKDQSVPFQMVTLENVERVESIFK